MFIRMKPNRLEVIYWAISTMTLLRMMFNRITLKKITHSIHQSDINIAIVIMGIISRMPFLNIIFSKMDIVE